LQLGVDLTQLLRLLLLVELAFHLALHFVLHMFSLLVQSLLSLPHLFLEQLFLVFELLLDFIILALAFRDNLLALLLKPPFILVFFCLKLGHLRFDLFLLSVALFK
jgi:hypothetical protein